MSVFSMSSMSGQDVVAIDTAEEIGTVKHFVVSPDGRRVERLHIDGRKKHALFAEWDDIESFGVDRVMVAAEGAPAPSEDDRDLDAVKGNIELVGARVLDTAGFEHGTVADASFDSESGEITAVTTSNGDDVAAERIHSLGSYALVVDA